MKILIQAAQNKQRGRQFDMPVLDIRMFWLKNYPAVPGGPLEPGSPRSPFAP